MTKKEIVESNKKLGLKTVFFGQANDILGYYENGTVFLNEFYPNDMEKTNKHEVLHMFEDSEKFKIAKDVILKTMSNKEKGQLYRQYYVKYAGLYSEDEIEKGVLDKEIAIDAIIGNGKFSKEVEETAKGLFDLIVGDKQSEKNYKKRYLNLALSNKIEQNFSQLTNWEKLFVLNYYAEEKKGLPNNKQTKYQEVRNDINNELERLYAFAEKEENFKIQVQDNKELEREFQGEIEALKSRGQEDEANYLLSNKSKALEEMAKKISKNLHAEYKHIVDFIKTSEYEPAFKCLMLRETLNKTYRQEKIDGESKTIVQKREPHKSIIGHMTLNDTVLRVIYNNLKEYSSFANLYFAGIEVFNKKITEKSGITISDVNTFGMGKWIKFEGKTSNEKAYIKNAQDLASLVQDTPWCTKQLASSHLADGDFYVFVDHDNKPHIAVKTNGNEIDEVRGIKNGNAQELENDYRKVAIEFLEKNKDIKHGKEWLEKEEWNKRLVEYIEKIERKEYGKIDFDQFCNDVFIFKDYKAHFEENSNKEKIIGYINTNTHLQGKIAKNFNCKVDEIYFEEYDATNYSQKIKVCLKDVDFTYSEEYDLSSLQSICGDAGFKYSQVTDLSSLQSIGGDADFEDSQVTDLSSLQSIGGDVYFGDSQVTDLSSLQSIGGKAYFNDSKIKKLNILQRIGGDAVFSYSKVTDLSRLQSIGGNADFSYSKVTKLNVLQRIGGSADFSDSKVTDLSSLQNIGGNADFNNSIVTDLSSLQRISGTAFFEDSQVTDLSSLQSIGEYVYFRNSKISDLSRLQSIGGGASFCNSQVTDLSALQSVGGNLNLINSKINNLFSLKEVKGKVFLDDWQAELFGDMFVREGDHYRFVPESERASLKEEIEK